MVQQQQQQQQPFIKPDPLLETFYEKKLAETEPAYIKPDPLLIRYSEQDQLPGQAPAREPEVDWYG